MAQATRRSFLATLCSVVAALVGLRCAPDKGAAPPSLAEQALRYDTALVCSDISRLWPAEAATRTTNEYVDRSTRPNEYCFACKNFIAPPAAGACGSCTTVKGPINPLAWCKSWTAKR